MIAQHESPVALFQARRRRRFRLIPIVVRIIFAQLDRRGLRIQTNQAAIRTLDNVKNFVGGSVQPIAGGEQDALPRRGTRRARIGA